MDYANLIGLGIQFLEAFLPKAQSKLPAEVLTALGAALDGLRSHHADLLTKANFEAQRG